MRTALVMLGVLIGLAVRLSGAILPGDGVRGRAVMNVELRGLLMAGNFAELDRRAADYAKTKETLPDGWWKLTQFFIGLGDPADKNGEAAWQAHLDKIARWVEAGSANETALTAQGVAYTRYAWAARGNGYADKVSETGWKLFTERLQRARSILESVRRGRILDQPPSAGWYTAMLTVALGQGWARGEYDAFFNEAIAAHPDYFEFYLKKGVYLLPRWHGASGEWQRFARNVGRRIGPEIFARICWANASFEGYSQLFTTCGIEWEELAAGFAELHRKYPQSTWTTNVYCRLACAAGKREIAAKLFEEIGDDPYPEAWPTQRFYRRMQAWSAGGPE